MVAVKGIGGYHLACRADDEGAVGELRRRKHREDKPFALMVPSVDAALELVELDDDAGALLVSRERPIVLAPRRPEAAVAASVAPTSPELGVMLPYSPLHHLLLADSGVPLVMTSANVSDEPIAYRDTDALERLAGIADLFLVGNREIHTRTDDSVARVVASRPMFLRRSRGYVPSALPLGVPRQLLACGAELKSTFCVAKGERAWVSHHIGDLSNYETLARSPKASSISSASSPSSRSWSSTTFTRSTCRPSSRSSSTGSRPSVSSTTTPIWPPALRNTGSTDPPSARSSTGPATGSTRRSGGRGPDR